MIQRRKCRGEAFAIEPPRRREYACAEPQGEHEKGQEPERGREGARLVGGRGIQVVGHGRHAQALFRAFFPGGLLTALGKQRGVGGGGLFGQPQVERLTGGGVVGGHVVGGDAAVFADERLQLLRRFPPLCHHRPRCPSDARKRQGAVVAYVLDPSLGRQLAERQKGHVLACNAHEHRGAVPVYRDGLGGHERRPVAIVEVQPRDLARVFGRDALQLGERA